MTISGTGKGIEPFGTRCLVPFSVTESRGLAGVAWAGGARYERSLPVGTPADKRPRAKFGPGGPNFAHATRLQPDETDEPKTVLALGARIGAACLYTVMQALEEIALCGILYWSPREQGRC